MNSQKNRKIWFVRHAQSEYNKQHLFTGWHDPLLTEKGMAAAMNLKQNFLILHLIMFSVLHFKEHQLQQSVL
jgi:bisphosphoglycerate-dependent phosphoglycerate mutase